MTDFKTRSRNSTVVVRWRDASDTLWLIIDKKFSERFDAYHSRSISYRPIDRCTLQRGAAAQIIKPIGIDINNRLAAFHHLRVACWRTSYSRDTHSLLLLACFEKTPRPTIQADGQSDWTHYRTTTEATGESEIRGCI